MVKSKKTIKWYCTSGWNTAGASPAASCGRPSPLRRRCEVAVTSIVDPWSSGTADSPERRGENQSGHLITVLCHLDTRKQDRQQGTKWGKLSAEKMTHKNYGLRPWTCILGRSVLISIKCPPFSPLLTDSCINTGFQLQVILMLDLPLKKSGVKRTVGFAKKVKKNQRYVINWHHSKYEFLEMGFLTLSFKEGSRQEMKMISFLTSEEYRDRLGNCILLQKIMEWI